MSTPYAVFALYDLIQDVIDQTENEQSKPTYPKLFNRAMKLFVVVTAVSSYQKDLIIKQGLLNARAVYNSLHLDEQDHALLAMRNLSDRGESFE